MSVAEELIVQIKTEGVDAAESGLDTLTESVSEVTDTIKEGGRELTEFVGSFRGSMAALLAGVVVVAAGLANAIPIIGELLAAFGAVATSVGIKIDEFLRPYLQDAVDEIYNIADAIDEAEGPMDVINALLENLSGTLVLVVGLFGALKAGMAALAATGLGGALSALAGFLKLILLNVAGTLLFFGRLVLMAVSLKVAIAALVAIIAAFAIAYIFDIGNTRDMTHKALGVMKEAWESFMELLGSLWSKAKQALADFASGLEDWASGLAADAKQYGKDLINGFIQGIREDMPLVDRALDFAGIDAGTGGGMQQINGSRMRQEYGMNAPVMIDGRDMSDRTARYRGDTLSRRGL